MKATEINPYKNITIGGSEVAAAIGKSDWVTPHKLWLRKTGREKPEPPTEAMRRGIVAEKFIHEFFMELNPDLKLKQYQMPMYLGVCRGTIDAIYTTPSGQILIVDYKTSYLDISENLPIQYLIQLNWYGGIYQKLYNVTPQLGVISCDGFFNIKFIPVFFDIELFEKLDDKIGEWYQNHIIDDIEPEMNTREKVEVIDKLRDLNSNQVELSKDIHFKLIKLQDLSIRKKDLEDEIENIKYQIKIAMGENSKAICGDFKISYDTQSRSSIDTKILKELVSEDIIKKCTKTSTFRVLRIS